MDLAFLSHVLDSEMVFEHVSTTGQIALQPGTRIPMSGSYCAVMLRGEVPHAVGDVRAHPQLADLEVTCELGAGAYCGVPVYLPDGQLYGTLCGMNVLPVRSCLTSRSPC